MLLFYFKPKLNMAQKLTEEEKKRRTAEKNHRNCHPERLFIFALSRWSSVCL